MSDTSPSTGPAMAQADLDSLQTPATVSAQAQTHLPPSVSIENALQARIDAQAFSPLCPSARTSYTRVDFSGANTPRRDFAGIEQDDGDDQDGEDGDREEGATGEDSTGEDAIPQTPQVSLTFLLVSGRRRSMTFEPEITVGRVKELVWNAWPNDWQDERPPAPSYLRILYLGKILQDEDSLDKLSFPANVPSPTAASTIVHLSIRAYAPQADELPKKKRRSAVVPSGSPERLACSDCSRACFLFSPAKDPISSSARPAMRVQMFPPPIASDPHTRAPPTGFHSPYASDPRSRSRSRSHSVARAEGGRRTVSTRRHVPLSAGLPASFRLLPRLLATSSVPYTRSGHARAISPHGRVPPPLAPNSNVLDRTRSALPHSPSSAAPPLSFPPCLVRLQPSLCYPSTSSPFTTRYVPSCQCSTSSHLRLCPIGIREHLKLFRCSERGSSLTPTHGQCRRIGLPYLPCWFQSFRMNTPCFHRSLAHSALRPRGHPSLHSRLCTTLPAPAHVVVLLLLSPHGLSITFAGWAAIGVHPPSAFLPPLSALLNTCAVLRPPARLHILSRSRNT